MIDLSFLQQFAKGDSRKMQRYIRMYLNTAPKILRKMEQCLQQEDWEQLRIHAHSLKPQTDYMGIAELKGVLVQIESEALQGQPSHLAGLCRRALSINRQASLLLRDALSDL